MATQATKARKASKPTRVPVGTQKITTFLWFDDDAEQAVEHYISIFANSKVLKVTHYPEGAPGPKGSVMLVEFQLAGQRFMALNGGPEFKFSEAISLSVGCDTQAEIDSLWAKLGEGGAAGPCGWLKDKYGLSWQIVPNQMSKWMDDKDPKRAQRVMSAVMKMGKLDIRALEAAYQGR
jgi:predicted 3-demethylubiquinone-9 3-methyltransferase (glyoxalase superfamily)